jgi:hypothetical protein
LAAERRPNALPTTILIRPKESDANRVARPIRHSEKIIFADTDADLAAAGYCPSEQKRVSVALNAQLWQALVQ